MEYGCCRAVVVIATICTNYKIQNLHIKKYKVIKQCNAIHHLPNSPNFMWRGTCDIWCMRIGFLVVGIIPHMIGRMRGDSYNDYQQ